MNAGTVRLWLAVVLGASSVTTSTAAPAALRPDPGAGLKRAVLASGKQWTRVKVEGAVGPVRFSEDAEYFVVRGMEAIREVPLRQVVGADFEAFLKDSLAADAGSTPDPERLYVMYRPALQAAEKIWLDRDLILQDPTAHLDRTICVPNPAVGMDFMLPEIDLDTVIREVRPGVLAATTAQTASGAATSVTLGAAGAVATPATGGFPASAGSGVVGSGATAGSGAGKSCFKLRDTQAGGGSSGCCSEFPQVYRACSKKITLSLTPPAIEIDEPRIDSPTMLQGFFEGALSFHASTSFRGPGGGSSALGGKMKVAYGTVFCVPVWARPVEVTLWAHADASVTAGMDGTVKLSKTWARDLGTVVLAVFVGPGGIPVIIDVPLQIGVVTELQTPALTRFSARSGVRTGFEVSCGFGGECRSVVPPYFERSTATPPGDVRFEAQAHLIAEPFVRSGIRASVVAPGFIYASVGPRLFTRLDLWGATGLACGDADGNGVEESITALTADHDIGADLLAEIGIGAGNPATNPLLNSLSVELWRKAVHLHFLNLGGGSALEPILVAPASAHADKPAVASAAMRPCWPYRDEISYSIGWGDGSTTKLKGTPQQPVLTEHAWKNPGTYQVRLEGQKDTHGREFTKGVAVTATRPVIVAAGPAATSSSASSGGKKKGTGLGSLDGSTVEVKVAETATTALAIRGMTAPQEARVTAADRAAGIVTARVEATGQLLRFRVGDAPALARLVVDQKVWADVSAGSVSIDGNAACCAVLAPETTPAAKGPRVAPRR